jgi:uncharacterized protein (TIGR03437 family)
LGKALKISAPASYYTGFNSRLDFVNWAGNAGSTLTLTPSADPQIARATFKTMRQFISAVDPAEGAQVVLDPPSADGFYDANSKVNVALVAQPGFRLDHWEGDLGGSDTAGWLTMGLPRQVIARMHPIPYVGPRAVRNAATEMHGDTVTACSIVTIAGLHLSTATESAPSGLPRQFLAGTGVRMGDSFLPLYAVSPTEISAQLPCNLLEGPNSLIVHAGYEPEVLSNFTVVRNSPGLFTRPVAGQSYAIATHNDGSAVTPDNPAVDGETVSVFGTGFGPLMTAAVAGIAIQPSPEFQLADPLEALLGTTPLSSSYAGAGGSQPGMDAVQVTVNAGGSSTFKVRINGKESNAVLLPVGN